METFRNPENPFPCKIKVFARFLKCMLYQLMNAYKIEKIPNFLNRNRYCIPKVWEWRLIFQRMVGKWECPQGSGETLMMGCLSCIFFSEQIKVFSELIDVFSELIGVFGRINVS